MALTLAGAIPPDESDRALTLRSPSEAIVSFDNRWRIDATTHVADAALSQHASSGHDCAAAASTNQQEH